MEKLTKEAALKRIDELTKYINDLPSSLEDIIREFEEKTTSLHFYSEKVQAEGNYIKIPLAQANTDWYFASYNYARIFCDTHTGCYPEIYKSHSNRYIYINCRALISDKS